MSAQGQPLPGPQHQRLEQLLQLPAGSAEEPGAPLELHAISLEPQVTAVQQLEVAATSLSQDLINSAEGQPWPPEGLDVQ